MKKLSQEEAEKVLEGMKVKIEIPKAAVTQWERNAALDMAIEALKYSEVPNSSDCISRQAAIDVLIEGFKRSPTIVIRAKDMIEQLPSAQPEPCESDEAAKRLNDLIFDINPAEICSQIESDNLKQWCEIIQTEMKMAMVQLPCWAERRTDERDIPIEIRPLY